MAGISTLTRNRYCRAIYDGLARIGITATVMYEYRRQLSTPPAETDGVTVRDCDPSTVAPLDAPVDEVLPGETLLAAFTDSQPIGYLFLSTDATHEIHPLEREMRFQGAYLRRVYVDANHRGQGVGTALVAAGCRRAADRGAEKASALVAIDNTPSRALFDRLGFEPRQRYVYARAGPLSVRSVTEC